MNIIKPTLIIDKAKMLKNIAKMCNKAKKNDIELRPHFKTHQSKVIGNFFREQGISMIAVSSISMAEYFAEDGWDDITVAIPVNILEINSINILAQKITLHILVDSLFTAEFLAKNLKYEVKCWIEIDSGDHRTGLTLDETAGIKKIVQTVQNSSNIHFQGLLTHGGQTYHGSSHQEICNMFDSSISIVKKVKGELSDISLNNVQISFGDTPSCSILNSFPSDINEMRPGNFVFFDVMQLALGSCSESEIAIALACPIISIHENLNQFVVYGGAIHLSKEFILDEDGQKNYGLAAPVKPDQTWDITYPKSKVISLSQEHGVIKAPLDVIKKLRVGDIVYILPIHSCLTANLFKNMLTTQGEKIDSFQYA